MILYKSVSLADQVFDQLEADILSGKYARGTMFTEMKLCEELGVSRTPVREALKRLEQEHIIESSGKGMIVLGITDNDARVLFAVRESVEGLAAAACAANIGDEQITDLKDNLELQEFYLSKRDSEKIKELDRKIIEEEKASIHEVMKAADMTPAELARLISFSKSNVPMSKPIKEITEDEDEE